jgi:hypothetical protein
MAPRIHKELRFQRDTTHMRRVETGTGHGLACYQSPSHVRVIGWGSHGVVRQKNGVLDLYGIHARKPCVMLCFIR